MRFHLTSPIELREISMNFNTALKSKVDISKKYSNKIGINLKIRVVPKLEDDLEIYLEEKAYEADDHAAEFYSSNKTFQVMGFFFDGKYLWTSTFDK